jgi:tetratricopeptide (TPR) repeat protein
MSDGSGGAPGAGGDGAGSAVKEKFRDAMARHQGGELDQAQGLYRDILRDQPDHADALHMLGLAAHQQGRNEDAKRLIADAVKIDDQNAFYHNNLGEVMRVLGETGGAASCYRAAIALQPGNSQTHNNLGLVLFQSDQAEVAVEEFNAALAIEPDAAGIHNNLGVVLEAMGRLEDAIPCFRRSLELAPEQAEVNNNLGAALFAQGEFEEAERHLLAAAEIDASVANVPFNLSRLYLEQGKLDAAMSAARKAIKIDPGYPDYYIVLGAIQRAMGDLDESLNSLRGAVGMDPAHAMALNDLGVCLLVLGRFDEARLSFRRALDAEPRLAIAHENLARAGRFGDADRKQIEFVEALASAANQTEKSQIHLHFALGKMLDDVGEYERAFQHFQSGNALEHKRMRFDADAGRSFVERSRATFDAAFVEKKSTLGNPSHMPIFVVGMLRSGTTLVEQILASHPLIYAGGELEYFRSLARQLPERLGDGQPYPDCLKTLDAETIEAVSADYIEGLRKQMGEAKRFTDKNPLNFEHLGLILLMFPNARVIHCRRHAMDLCLSVYFQHFSQRHDFAYSFADIAEYHRQYEQLMAHWHSVFPGRIHDVQYETLVADLETVSRDIIEYLDLEWDENCLEFHRTVRPVGTASHWQVRQPLYTRSVERWRHYEPCLAELRAVLASQQGR